MREPLMPKGVEQTIRKFANDAEAVQMREPLMPKGVEQLTPLGRQVVSDEYAGTSDAERR